MATTTPNFGWPVPTSTDLVKDGATAIEGLGDAIDASLLDLKGGTTGQVLKKNTNADMDFVWSADSAGMTNPMTTTGDTIYSSSGSTPARLGIGSTGQVLTVAGGVPSWATPSAGGSSFVGASVFSSVAVNVASATYTAVPFNSENFDTDGFHDNTTNNTRITIPTGKGGKYAINFMAVSQNMTGKLVTRLYKNGGANGKITVVQTTDDSSYIFQSVETFVAGDYFELFINQNSGSTKGLEGGAVYNWLIVTYLGA